MHIRIIAEAGVNHNGSLALAKQLALKAKEAGADYVKYQTFIPELLTSRSAKTAEYQKENTKEDSQLEMLRKLALSQDAFRELKSYCESIDICFLSTAFDLESLSFLEELGIPFWKIPSGELTNLPYLKMVARTGREIVLSTGMAENEEIRDALSVLQQEGAGEITILHCTTQYPTPLNEVNLLAMDTLKAEFGLPVGYSDHTEGILVPVAAAARGAVVIEKHFTLDRSMEGPDHKASLEPDELKEMVSEIRKIEMILGDGVKSAQQSEKKNITVARKSIVTKTAICKNEVITEDMLTTKRPGTGISPMKWNEVIGKRANRDYDADEVLDKEVLAI